MKSYSNLISLIIVLVIWLGLIIGCNKRADFAGQAPAVITSVSSSRPKSGTYYTVYFRYTVNGKTYEDSSTGKSTYQTGMQGKACYIPSKPQNGYFVLPNEACGQ